MMKTTTITIRVSPFVRRELERRAETAGHGNLSRVVKTAIAKELRGSTESSSAKTKV